MTRQLLYKAFTALGELAAAGQDWSRGLPRLWQPRPLTMVDFNKLAAGGAPGAWVTVEGLRFECEAPPLFKRLEYVRVHRCVFTFPSETFDGFYLHFEKCNSVEVNSCSFQMWRSPNEWRPFQTKTEKIPDTHIGAGGE